MRLSAIRLQRYRGFKDSGWLSLSPITLLFGANSSGKSSLLQSILLIKQTVEDATPHIPLLFNARGGVDLGSYEDIIYRHSLNADEPLSIGLRWTIEKRDFPNNPLLAALGHAPSTFELTLSVGYNRRRRIAVLTQVTTHLDASPLFAASRSTTRDNARFSISSPPFADITSDNTRVEFANFVPNPVPAPRRARRDSHRMLATFFERVWDHLFSEFMDITHLGPLRAEPIRTYHFSGENPLTVGRSGEYAMQMLYLNRFESRGKRIEANVNRWLSAVTGCRYQWSLLPSNLAQLRVNDVGGEVSANLKDVGMGVSQVLPVLIEGFSSPRGATILVEQPEIHLHPRSQAQLMDAFIAMTRVGKRLIIETHSEHMLLRLRRRIAETWSRRTGTQRSPNDVFASDCSAYFVSKTPSGSRVDVIPFTDNGNLASTPSGFETFFSEDYEEIDAFMRAMAAGNNGAEPQ